MGSNTRSMGLEGWALAGAIIGSILLLLWLIRTWMQGPKVKSKASLEGKTVVITGANTGIGKLTALDMSRRGAKVVMLCRDMKKAETAADEIRQETKGEVMIHSLDLASLESVRCCRTTGKFCGKDSHSHQQRRHNGMSR